MTTPAGHDGELDGLDYGPDTVVWVEDGQIFVEEDTAGSPCSWPVEEDS
jgi:hypothetical protein